MKIPITKAEKFASKFSWCIATALIVYTAIMWQQIPEQVPTHFGFSGQADNWGHKVFVCLLPLIYLGTLGLSLIVRKSPSLINLPFKLEGEAKEKGLELSYQMLAVVNLIIGVLFSYLTYEIIHLEGKSIGSKIIPGFVLALGAVVIFYLRKIRTLR